MRKLLFFAMSAMLLAACSSEELNVQTPSPDVTDNAAVTFDAYALRGVTRAGTAGDVTNGNIGTTGFGVFAYYTASTPYSKNAKPDFMFNQKVVKTGDAWTYEPVKYWPNEFGETAKSDNTDYVTFFAYAPWTDFVPTTGAPVPVTSATVTESVEHQQNYNIIGIKDNETAGDPIVQYRVDTDPATSVDLLWGVAANATDYAPIATNNRMQNVTGLPFLNLTKPSDASASKLNFRLQHALAKVKITIDYISDATAATNTATINKDETRIFLRQASISGLAMEGALNLNNTQVDNQNLGIPLWKDIDGENELAFAEAVEFFDGRRDGYEGTTNGANNMEKLRILNPKLVENYAATSTNGEGVVVFGDAKNPGVTTEAQSLFTSSADGFFYVIPRNAGQNVDLRLVYDVETIDARIAGLLADRVTHGKSIENDITKVAIFGDNIDFEPGKQYVITIHLGMTSVKVDAEVMEWTETDPVEVEVPTVSMADALGAAISYVYPDRAYSGTWSLDSNLEPPVLTYSNTTAAAITLESGRPAILNDIARMLGALYRAGGVRSLSLGGKDFTWDPNGTLKGSNWVDSDGNTLVSQLGSMYGTNIPESVTVETDKGTFILKLVLS